MIIKQKKRRLLMPIFKDFAENGEFLGSKNEPLNKDNFEKYLIENGLEKALGYLEALEDIRIQFKSFLEVEGRNSWRYNTDRKISRGTVEVYEERNDFLDFAKKIVNDNYKI